VCFDMGSSSMKEGEVLEAACAAGCLDDSFFENDSVVRFRDVCVRIQGEQRRRNRTPLDEPHEFSLGAGVSVDVTLICLDGAMASQQLHVPSAAAQLMSIAGRDGDETTPA